MSTSPARRSRKLSSALQVSVLPEKGLKRAKDSQSGKVTSVESIFSDKKQDDLDESKTVHGSMEPESRVSKNMGLVLDAILEIPSLYAFDPGCAQLNKFSAGSMDWIHAKQSSGLGGHLSFQILGTRPRFFSKQTICLKQVIETPEYLKCFDSYLEENGLDSVIDFLVDVEDFRRVRHDKTKETTAKGIYDRHISESSSRRVKYVPMNAFSSIGDSISKGNAPENLFDEVYKIVFTCAENEEFRSFSQTPAYLEMLSDDLQKELMHEDSATEWHNDVGFQSVHVDVISAYGLSLGESHSKPDLFVEVSLGSKCYKTKVAKSTLSPNWDEHFEFQVSKSSQFIKCCIIDKDIIGNRHFYGLVKIYLADLKEPFLPQWYPLKECPNEDQDIVSGDLHLRVSLSKLPSNESRDPIIQEAGGVSLSEMIKGKVSKKKIRFQEDGFNLDLTYITESLIAMGFPSESIEGIYRNSMKDVQKFFVTRHPNHYKIYNLCSERDYSEDRFEKRVARFPFDDHNPCPFNMILEICRDIDVFLKEHPQNVVSVHCKAGKGRTGLIVSSYLLYSQPREFKDADMALEFFATKRTKNKKGVTIPSQIRYVRYFDKFLKSSRQVPGAIRYPDRQTLLLKRITIRNIGSARPSGSVNFQVVMPGLLAFNSRAEITCESLKDKDEDLCVFLVPKDLVLPLDEDVKFIFILQGFLRTEKLFHFWLNTRFIDNLVLDLEKHEIDRAVKDKANKVFPPNLKVKLEFDKMVGSRPESFESRVDYLKSFITRPSRAYDWENTYDRTGAEEEGTGATKKKGARFPPKRESVDSAKAAAKGIFDEEKGDSEQSHSSSPCLTGTTLLAEPKRSGRKGSVSAVIRE